MFISTKKIPTGGAASAIEFYNGAVIDQINETQMPHEGSNCIIYTPRDYGFGMDVHDVGKRHVGKQYIHDSDQVIPINFGKALIHENTQETNYWNI